MAHGPPQAPDIKNAVLWNLFADIPEHHTNTVAPPDITANLMMANQDAPRARQTPNHATRAVKHLHANPDICKPQSAAIARQMPHAPVRLLPATRDIIKTVPHARNVRPTPHVPQAVRHLHAKRAIINTARHVRVAQNLGQHTAQPPAPAQHPQPNVIFQRQPS